MYLFRLLCMFLEAFFVTDVGHELVDFFCLNIFKYKVKIYFTLIVTDKVC
jgi:hypothetical protein